MKVWVLSVLLPVILVRRVEEAVIPAADGFKHVSF
jgi:hypothetical protein